MHWSPEHIDALLEGNLPANEQKVLLEHIAEPCEQCERTLLAEGLDIDALARLIAAETAPEEHISPVERQSIWRAVAPEAKPRKGWWTKGAAVALAAAAIFLVFPRAATPPDTGVPFNIKGSEAETIDVELRVIAGKFEADGFKSDRRIESGQAAQQDETLLFELDAEKEGTRYLFAIDGAGGIIYLHPPQGHLPEIEAAGRRQVSFDDQLVALDLVDVTTPLTLVGTASPTALDPQKDVVEPWQQERGALSYVVMTIEVAQ